MQHTINVRRLIHIAAIATVIGAGVFFTLRPHVGTVEKLDQERMEQAEILENALEQFIISEAQESMKASLLSSPESE